ncbi:MarR family winged helix-turn-helix transcriptional regulator [Nocardioides pantholopis]|uniref:MarR family winged helix-turn-helix transcriptional regulator n=1 Tax=Nocardioides pantholopis TaxID=2483798 RepID=UPI000F07A85A|nr:MarR family winged helix-turn-helix transcriptional regulator [Nocardioides pantholopis]
MSTSVDRVDLSFLLNQASYAFAARLGDALSDLGISVREFCVLMKAAEQERTQNQVAELASLDKTTMVVTLDGLERAGLAERRVSSADRRARVVVVTAQGLDLLAQAYDVVDEAVEASLGVLDEPTRRTFLEALTVLTQGPWATPSHTAPVRRRQPRPTE